MFGLVDRWLLLTAERIHAQAEILTRLDQAIGDGDHGANLDRGFTAIVALVEAGRFDEAVALLRQALAEDPDDPVTRSYLAIAVTESGRPAEGLALLEALAADYYRQRKGDYVRVLYGRLCRGMTIAGVAEALGAVPELAGRLGDRRPDEFAFVVVAVLGVLGVETTSFIALRSADGSFSTNAWFRLSNTWLTILLWAYSSIAVAFCAMPVAREPGCWATMARRS